MQPRAPLQRWRLGCVTKKPPLEADRLPRLHSRPQTAPWATPVRWMLAESHDLPLPGVGVFFLHERLPLKRSAGLIAKLAARIAYLVSLSFLRS